MGRCYSQKLGMLSGNALARQKPLCANPMLTYEISVGKEGTVCGEVHVESQALQCANCKAVEVVDYETKRGIECCWYMCNCINVKLWF